MREGPPLPFKPETDAEGLKLCNSALWNKKCSRQRGGGTCRYSHNVPEALQNAYALRREDEEREKREANREQRRLKYAPPPPPRPVSSGVERLREETVLHYDPLLHPLSEHILAVLECAPGEPLHELHLRQELPEEPPLCPTLHHAFKLGGRKLPASWRAVMGPGRNRRVINRLQNSDAYASWLRCYDDWIRAVVRRAAGYHIVPYHSIPCHATSYHTIPYLPYHTIQYNTTHSS